VAIARKEDRDGGVDFLDTLEELGFRVSIVSGDYVVDSNAERSERVAVLNEYVNRACRLK